MNILSVIKLKTTSILASIITILTLSVGGLFVVSQSGFAQDSGTPPAPTAVPANSPNAANTLFLPMIAIRQE